MSLGLLLLLAFAAPRPSVRAAEPRAADELRSLASFKAPPGWLAEDDDVLGDPLVRFSSGPFVIRVSLFGGESSRHKSPEAFLSSFEALGERNEPPAKLGPVRVGGRERPLYTRTYEVSIGDPHSGAGAGMRQSIRDEFVIVPAGKRFLVLTFKTETLPPPEPDARGAAAWKKFLKGFRLKKKDR